MLVQLHHKFIWHSQSVLAATTARSARLAYHTVEVYIIILAQQTGYLIQCLAFPFEKAKLSYTLVYVNYYRIH